MAEEFNCIPKDVISLLEKLYFLAKIKNGNKLNTVVIGIDNPDSWMDSFKRSIQGESRTRTIDYLQTVYDDLVLIIKKYKDNDIIIHKVLDNIGSAISGIENLKSTYQNDPFTLSKLQVLIEIINSCTGRR